MSAVVLGNRHEDFVDELETLGVKVTRRLRDGVDLIFYGAEFRTDLGRLKEFRHNLSPDGALWVIRPKGSTEIRESEVLAAGRRAGLVDVKVASFSATHTAEKFVIPRADRK